MTAPIDRYVDAAYAVSTVIDRDARRPLIAAAGGAAPPVPDGIDFVELVPQALPVTLGVPGLAQRRTLLVHLLRGPVPAHWTAANVHVSGGVRHDPALNPVLIEWAAPARAVLDDPYPPAVTPADRVLIGAAVPEPDRDRVLVVRTSTRGDLSDYQLRIVEPGTTAGDPALDPPLAQDAFTFRVDCPNPLDCASPRGDAPQFAPQPALDYLARDYTAVRGRLLDRLATTLPGWDDRDPADVATTLIEMFAYLADHWAYTEDAIAAEAYLGTARMRTSIRRHARLLGYRMDEGASATAWLAFGGTGSLAAGAGFADADDAAGMAPVAAAVDGACVFETVRPLALFAERGRIDLHAWEDADAVLPAGATAAFVRFPDAPVRPLRAGDPLILAELPDGGDVVVDPQRGDPLRRYLVRLDRDAVQVADALAPADPSLRVWEIRWRADDALPGPLRISRRGVDGAPDAAAVALGNVVPARQGATVVDEPLGSVPDDPIDAAAFRPRLERTGVGFTDGVADVLLFDGERSWRAVSDLVGATPTDPAFVVEPDDRGVARLRFGDGVCGRAVAPGAAMTATYRVTRGAEGNVAPGALTVELARGPADPATVDWVFNPLAATGGRDPESGSTVRELAPFAFRAPLRAVTVPDYAATAAGVDGVQGASSRRRWNGSWQVLETVLDPLARSMARPADVVDRVRAVLEQRRMAGVDIEVDQPPIAPLHIEVRACAAPDRFAAHVLAALRDAYSARTLPGGARGLFHPDRLTFGQAIRLSDVVAAGMAVPGVQWLRVTVFRRLDDPDAADARNLAAGVIAVDPRELPRCDSDVDRPEDGRVDVIVGGGR